MFKRRRRRPENIIPLTPVRSQIVSIDEFVRLYETKGADIQSARIVPPRLGSDDFGKILIEWKSPVYVSAAALQDEVFA